MSGRDLPARAFRFELASELPCSAESVWQYHLAPGALDRLTPPFPPAAVTDRGCGVAVGSVVELQLGRGPLARKWLALHTTVEPPHVFVDVALESPFRYWIHQHVVEALGPSRSRLRDVVHFVPAGPLPVRLGGLLARIALSLLFRWRHRRTRRDLAAAAGRRSRGPIPKLC